MEIRIGNKIFDNDETNKDIMKIQDMMRELGFNLSFEETQEMWSIISDKYCASFLIPPKNTDELLDYLCCIEV